MESKGEEAQYRLLDHYLAPVHCDEHGLQTLQHLAASHAADSGWVMEFVGIDLIRYTCTHCGSYRVYKILPEKALL